MAVIVFLLLAAGCFVAIRKGRKDRSQGLVYTGIVLFLFDVLFGIVFIITEVLPR